MLLEYVNTHNVMSASSDAYLTAVARAEAEGRQRANALRERYMALHRAGPRAVQNYHADLEAAALREAARERQDLMNRIVRQQINEAFSQFSAAGRGGAGAAPPPRLSPMGEEGDDGPFFGRGLPPFGAGGGTGLSSVLAGSLRRLAVRPSDGTLLGAGAGMGAGLLAALLDGGSAGSGAGLGGTVLEEEDYDHDLARATAASLEQHHRPPAVLALPTSSGGAGSRPRLGVSPPPLATPPPLREIPAFATGHEADADAAFNRDLQLALALSSAEPDSAGAGGSAYDEPVPPRPRPPPSAAVAAALRGERPRPPAPGSGDPPLPYYS